ncbi:hypothetical protein [Pseudomonas sp.]|uniref:hypothetical protein n=1 Tax=Pseudomonas sp. TaxID=306 RepID=UPI002CA1E475|nr:hypothetical protein [Pseudomonas sp.]HUE91492.1 hypothetical protein [Pseudomonas sp.]
MSKVKTQFVIEGQNKTGPAFSQVDKSLSSLSGSAKAAGSALAGALSVGVIATWVKRSVDAADGARKLAQGAGLTTKAFTGLEFAFSQSGLGRGEMAKSFSQLNRAMVQAAEGAGRPGAAFKALGVSVTGAAGQLRAGDEVLRELADKFQNLPDGVEKSALAADIFGRSLGSKMIPLLNAGAQGIDDLVKQAERLGLVIGDEQAAKSEQFNDQLATLGKVSEGAANTVAGELLPTLTQMTGLLVEVSEDGESAKVMATALGYGLKALAIVAVVVGASFKRMGNIIGGAAAAAVEAAKLNFSGAADILRNISEDNEKVSEDMLARIKKIASGGYEELGKKAAETQAKIATANESMAASTQDYARRALRSLRDLVAAEKVAQRDIERIRADRLKIEQRYAEAIAGFRSGGETQANFGAYQDLKLAADRALAAGDAEGAQRQAQAALKVLQDMAAAGESTYGFEGLAKGLQQIEEAAKDLEQGTAEQKIRALKDELDGLMADVKVSPELDEKARAKLLTAAQDLAEQLNNVLTITPTVSADPAVHPKAKPVEIRQDSPNSFTNLPPVEVDVIPTGIRQDGENSFTNLPPVSVDLQVDQEAAGLAQQQIAELAQRLSAQLIIPVTPVVGATGAQQPPQVDGYATGGLVRGAGSGTSDSIPALLSNGEYVIRAAAVSRLGQGFLDLLNQGMPISRFADGGLVDASVVAGAAEPRFKSFGRLDIAVGGQVLQTYVQTASVGDQLRRLSMKMGRTHPRN